MKLQVEVPLQGIFLLRTAVFVPVKSNFSVYILLSKPLLISQ
jgi:hypothetical protein